jgi:hypothetical protein
MTMKLFKVETVENEIFNCKDVEIFWYKANPNPGGRPYAQLIANYSSPETAADAMPLSYLEETLDQLFTRDEAEQLKAYLDTISGGITTIDEVALPLTHITRLSILQVDRYDRWWELAGEPGYPLPFLVTGSANLLGYELADGSGRRAGLYP